ncbi:cilia- and flagella-associated protein 43 isoform X1 [Corythoichthys intestinalis]|uniref:cilia- and flagella-associated protein 43 isoform X1 n=1 Tax=Corythoichthys intestinalis TaxID=161448 RepID=UPI0025A57129|nr:cilia- and flagella-associated protein 43 isoform X1 [Corythoichthys intestinalis]XP_057704811.1 cilia- and flagella-associated protein 43 isoform X1 [Corythoichthys intestinalis]XP_057704812.1 cilia- and flagella-associated protein 43 isoform X1 [Corythoichthys intestinalis]XP_057704813.1 cilia- and flagella-associated protein 43 isoform X1 [Corythoichthys intestinalis]XP_057704814.1 cilia- and flagella-associated protein 43 isoform X1 [Corythoichthys intestinalis]XP_057704815.1 cilia- and
MDDVNTDSPETEDLSKDYENYSETKENLLARMEEIRSTIKEMILENETVPEIERLELKEFNVDDQRQKMHDATMEEEVSRVRDRIEMEILERCYKRDLIKRDCWDSLKVKDRAVKAFHTEHEVTNYPLKERPQSELDALKRVENKRKEELAQEYEDLSEAQSSVASSYSAELGLTHPQLYDQFSLHTTEQKMNQIVLLQDVIYRIKVALNTQFDKVYKQKGQEINRVKERNKQVKELLDELEVNEELWEPVLNDREVPERVFIVKDSEIKAEKYLTPEQEKEEERKRLEEQKRLAAKSDNVRERALDDMMDGVLEVKKESLLKAEVPEPEFIQGKPNNEWTDEEKKQFKEYEKKVKEFATEKEKYRKSLENEIKGLQKLTKEATERFDEGLKKLFERKIKSDMAICQEELKIKILNYSVLMEEVLGNEEKELVQKFKKMSVRKKKMEEDLQKFEKECTLFQESHENIVADDKNQDKDFRKEFSNLHKAHVDQLYKLFKRRPRGHKSNAMDELDSQKNMPEGLNLPVWEKFCQIRRTKIDTEHQIKSTAATLAEMIASLQKRREDDLAAEKDIEQLALKLENLREEKENFLTDIPVQFLLKQGQVEVTNMDLIPDYSDSILLDRSKVEELNQTIRTLGEQKIATMVQTKDFRKGIIQVEWDNTMRRMQIEDLKNKERDIQKMRLTEDHKEYLKSDGDNRVCKQTVSMKETQALQLKNYQKDVKYRKQKIRHIQGQVAYREKKNDALDKQVQDMHVTVSQMRHIYEASATEENEAVNTEQRYQELLLVQRLKDTATYQMEKLAFLTAEMQRLKMRNVPSLTQIKYK